MIGAVLLEALGAQHHVRSRLSAWLGIALVFALLARTLRRGSVRTAIIAGVAGGISIFACYDIAFLVTDRLVT